MRRIRLAEYLRALILLMTLLITPYFSLAQEESATTTLQSTSMSTTTAAIMATSTPSATKVHSSITFPTPPSGSTVIYSQTDDSGIMTTTDYTFDLAHVGNLDLGLGPINISFIMQGLYAPSGRIHSGEVCFVEPEEGQCTRLQEYYLTEAEKDLLADDNFHAFNVTTNTTVRDYANGTRPVKLILRGLPTQYLTNFKSNAAGTKPYVVIRKLKPAISSVLFLPGFQGSRLYYRDGLGFERQVWDPSFRTDIPYLEMNSNGTSKYSLYTKDIIDTVAGNHPLRGVITSSMGPENLEVYSQFAHTMDTLVASSTFGMKEWRAYPYDWRYDVRDIVKNGTATRLPNGTITQVYLLDVLREMASSSPTGKVTIVAHSNGGLLARALAVSFYGSENSREFQKYVDRVVTVGTPNLGAPIAIGSMLHGDDQSHGLGFIANAKSMRAVGQTIPGAYGLLPNYFYFARGINVPVTFDLNAKLSAPFAWAYGTQVTNYNALKGFLTDSANLNAKVGNLAQLSTPIPLSRTLIDKAFQTHFSILPWEPAGPDLNLKLFSIAGWGQDTVEGYNYTTTEPKFDCSQIAATTCPITQFLEHAPILTNDGDGTVISESAFGKALYTHDAVSMYFNTEGYGEDGNGNYLHRTLMAAREVHDFIINLLQAKSVRETPYLTKAIPPAGDTTQVKLRISSHSPINTVVTDVSGKKSGVIVMPGTDFALKVLDIPGSSVQVVGDEQYITVPQGGIYQVSAAGYAPGPSRFDVEMLDSSGAVIQSTSIANVPTTASSTATFIVSPTGTPSSPSVDVTGDGKPDFSMPGAAEKDPLVYVRYMKVAVATLPFSAVQKKNILSNITQIEGKLTLKRPNRTQALGVAKGLETHIISQVKLYNRLPLPQTSSTQFGIPPAPAEVMLGMLSQLKKLLT